MFSSYKSILIAVFVLMIGVISVLLFVVNRTNSSLKQTSLAYLPNTKVTIDSSKANISKNVSITFSSYIQDLTKFPVSFNTASGNYEYNISFDKDKINILFAADPKLSLNNNLVKELLSQLVIASSEQKSDKNLTSGSLFDKQIRDDHLNYLNKVINDNSVNQLSVVNLQ